MFCKQLMLGSLALLLALFVHPMVAAAIAFLAGNGFYSQRNPLYYILCPAILPLDVIRSVRHAVGASADQRG